MRVALIADTHGYYDWVIEYFNGQAAPDLLIHLGDHSDDGTLIAEALKCPYQTVYGNNDDNSIFHSEYEKILSIGTHRLYLLHGHQFAAYQRREKIVKRCQKENCDIAVFGHSHEYMDQTIDGIRVINPGSPSLPRGDRQRSFVLLDLSEGIEVCRMIYGRKN